MIDPEEVARTIAAMERERRARVFARVREDHKREIAEDYVELVADLIEAQGEARAVDLARRLGVSEATVNNTIARLAREGYVATAPYKPISLTQNGEELAEMARRRHRIILTFLLMIGVAPDVAEADSEGMEHHLSDETLRAIEGVTGLLVDLARAKKGEDLGGLP